MLVLRSTGREGSLSRAREGAALAPGGSLFSEERGGTNVRGCGLRTRRIPTSHVLERGLQGWTLIVDSTATSADAQDILRPATPLSLTRPCLRCRPVLAAARAPVTATLLLWPRQRSPWAFGPRHSSSGKGRLRLRQHHVRSPRGPPVGLLGVAQSGPIRGPPRYVGTLGTKPARLSCVG